MSRPFLVFTPAPDFSTPPRRKYFSGTDVSQLGAAPGIGYFHGKKTHEIQTVDYTSDGLADDLEMRRKLREAAGGFRTMLVPSWRSELKLTADHAAGAGSLTFDDSRWGASLLTDWHHDNLGKYIWTWNATNGLAIFEAVEILDATPGAQEILIAQDLPAAIATTDLIGLCRPMRLSRDSHQARYQAPGYAKRGLTWQEKRLKIDDAQAEIFTAQTFQQHQFFTSWSAPTDGTPHRTDFLMAGADGPYNLHVADPNQYTTRYTAWKNPTDGRIYIQQLAEDAVDRETTPGAQTFLFGTETPDVQSLALAFDQLAYEIIAYENSSQQIEIRWKLLTTVQSETWEGYNPVLFYNGLVDPAGVSAGESDVICYYLHKDSNHILWRAQRENFATEHTLHVPFRPFRLEASERDDDVEKFYVIDQGQRAGQLVSDPYTDPIPEPILPPDNVDGSEGDSAGSTLEFSAIYESAIKGADDAEEAGSTLEFSAIYESAIKGADDAEEAGSTLEFSAIYESAIKGADDAEEAGSTFDFTTEYTKVTREAPAPDQANSTLELTTTYEEAP
jgi:hypothetical protein